MQNTKKTVFYSMVSTMFNNNEDKPQNHETTLAELFEKLETSAKVSCDPNLKWRLKETSFEEYYNEFGIQKRDFIIPSIMSAIYKPDTARANRNVEMWGNLAIIDIDDAPKSFGKMVTYLDAFNVSYFLSTTTSHIAESPHFRIYFPLDRPLDVWEVSTFWGSLHLMLDKMPDEQTKDLSRLMFMPRNWTGVENRFHSVADKDFLVVDDVVAQYPFTPEEVATTNKQINRLKKKLSSETPIDVGDFEKCLYVNKSAKSAYDAPIGGRFYKFMCRVAFAAILDGYDISAEELLLLGKQADVVLGGYSAERVGGLEEAVRAIEYILPRVAEFIGNNAEFEEFDLPVKKKQIDMDVNFVDGPCGSGKSRFTMIEMAKNPDLYVFCADKIKSLTDRTEEIKDHLQVHSPHKPTETEIIAIYSDSDDDETSVQIKIQNAKVDIEEKLEKGWITSAAIFITHKGLMMNHWSGWSDWNVVIDEIPDVMQVFTKKFPKTHSTIADYLEVHGTDGDAYTLQLSSSALQYSEDNEYDDLLKQIGGILQVADDKNSKLWVLKEGWDDPVNFPMKFFGLFLPDTIKPFKSRLILGDQFLKSLFKKVWEEHYSINFVEAEFWTRLANTGQLRVRATPLKDRATIYYATDDNASFTRWKMNDTPLKKYCKALNENIDGPVLYTVSDKFEAHVSLTEGEYIPPKAHGRNDLQHHTNVAWLATMRSSGQTYNLIRKLTGMTSQELDEDRELNAAYQFVMRGTLRDYSSDKHCNIYVFSKTQAEYLSNRLGGASITKMKTDIAPILKKTAGRKPVGDRAATDAERAKKYRDKKRKEREEQLASEAIVALYGPNGFEVNK